MKRWSAKYTSLRFLQACAISFSALAHRAIGLQHVSSSLDLILQQTPALWGETYTNDGRTCAPLDAIPIAGINLTAEEEALLPSICWQPDRVPGTITTLPQLASSELKTIPPGVTCDVVQWCVKDGGCADVCRRGSVFVEPWLKNAINIQNSLSRRLPFCYSTVLGTHNSGITLADGYGVLDPYFQTYFEWIKFASKSNRLQTNDHVLSLTDQLNLGVRLVELDTHWVQGDFAISHCGGFHSILNTLIKAVNLVSKLLGHAIRWDTETIGCDPSLSSIPTKEQRSMDSALEEIAEWLAVPANSGEFLTLFFDNARDLGEWGLVPLMLSRIESHFPIDTVYTPDDHRSRASATSTATSDSNHFSATWPTTDEMVAAGHRVLLTSRIDYGAAMQPLMFKKGKPVCNFFEPNLTTYVGEPDCIADAYPYDAKKLTTDGVTLSGQLFRQVSCEIMYGPLNCDFILQADNEPLLDEASLPGVARCGINVPSPDMFTPQRAAAAVWTWAPSHPFVPLAHEVDAGMDQGTQKPRWRPLRAVTRWWRWLWWRRTHPEDKGCGTIWASDGRWRAVPCGFGDHRPTACRKTGADPTLQPTTKLWSFGSGGRGSCPPGFSFVVPATAKENTMLQARMRKADQISAWLPLSGPEWSLQ